VNAFAPDAGWLSFHPHPRKPRYAVPSGAVDAHCHVFGPGDRFPYAPERKYTPADAGKKQLFALRDFLGFSRNVLVQATCHGADNRALADALRSSSGRARGVATVRPEVSEGELADLHAAGVRAIRFNFVRRLASPEADDRYYLSLAERVAERGWHVVVYFEAPDLAERWKLFASMPTAVVVDHMGRPSLAEPVDGPGFALFTRFMAEHENVWCKVTGAERLSVTGPPEYTDFVPFARRVVERFPDRVLWGTDWPHPNMRSHVPDDGILVDLIPRIAPAADVQHRLLVSNPLRLYWES
jgi:2-pyrone-4,6-dicarboxylate lactonase